MNVPIILSFAGSKKQDFLIYLAAILTELGMSCMISDFTEEEEFRRYIPISEDLDKIFTYRNVEYQFHIPLFPDVISDYQVILLDAGMYIRDTMTACQDISNLQKHWFLVSSPLQQDLKAMIQNAKELEIPPCMIFQKLGEEIVTGTYLRNILQSNNVSFSLWYDIPFDLIDYEYDLRMQYEHLQAFECQSVLYKKAILGILSNYFSFDEKLIMKAYRQARKGRRRCR